MSFVSPLSPASGIGLRSIGVVVRHSTSVQMRNCVLAYNILYCTIVWYTILYYSILCFNILYYITDEDSLAVEALSLRSQMGHPSKPWEGA